MAQEYLLASQLLYALGLLTLAAYLLFRDFENRVGRVFSLFLFLRAAQVTFNQIERIDTGHELFWEGVRGYFLLAIPFVLIDLFLVFNWRQASTRLRATRVAFGVLGIAILVAYAFDHTLLTSRDDRGLEIASPLTPIKSLAMVLVGAFSIWFAVAANRSERKNRSKFYYLLALGFATAAVADGALPWAWLLARGLGAFGPLPLSGLDSAQAVLLLTPLALGSCAATMLVVSARRAGHESRSAWTAALVGGIAMASLLGALIFSASGPYLLLLGLLRLVFPGIVGYAIAKQTRVVADPFRLDSHARLTIKRGTLGGIFLASFFAFSEVATNAMQDLGTTWNVDPVWGQVLGGLAALGLLLALQPVRHMGERMAQTALPDARPLGQMSRMDRERLYSEQAQLAWEDGTLSRKERRLLDQLRERLQIPPEDASRMESRAAGA